MITIPVTVAIPYFKKQIDFFQYQHIEVYGDNAKNKVIIPIVKRNNKSEEIKEDIDWNMRLPYKMVDSILDIYNLEEDWYIPTNVFTAAKQVIRHLPNDEIVEIIDADLVHLKKYDGYIPKRNEIIADATYENWHLKTSTKQSEHFPVISKYLRHQDFKYMNGGFNVISRVDTIRRIIDEVIQVSIDISRTEKGSTVGWWQAMYGLNVACHNNRIKMIDTQNCYYPSINKIKPSHHIAHYCCDNIFDKRNMENISENEFPDNEFYNQAKKWLKSV
jgi:hypothetical protein